MSDAWRRFMDLITRWTEIATIVILAALVAVIAASVIMRYAFGATMFYAEELSRYLLVWIVFFASSLAIRNGSHVGVELVRQWLPPPARRLMVYLSHALLFLFLAALGLISVIYLVPPLWTQVTVAMGIRLFWIFLCIPIGALLMLLQLIDVVLAEARGSRV
jgi:TRAP-type C4-dicarboxylate transport system permease small subunit